MIKLNAVTQKEIISKAKEIAHKMGLTYYKLSEKDKNDLFIEASMTFDWSCK